MLHLNACNDLSDSSQIWCERGGGSFTSLMDVFKNTVTEQGKTHANDNSLTSQRRLKVHISDL